MFPLCIARRRIHRDDDFALADSVVRVDRPIDDDDCGVAFAEIARPKPGGAVLGPGVGEAGDVGFEVGMGTAVKLEYADGRIERYSILGVWDRDEDLNIISCESPMAKALLGTHAGDELDVPSESGPVPCKVVEISVLSDDVRAWLNDLPEPVVD